MQLRPHQREALQKLSNGKVLCGSVGSGKSLTAVVYWYTTICGGGVNPLRARRTHIPCYVITTAKKRNDREWDLEFARVGIDRSDENGDAHVLAWNEIYKVENVSDAFFIFDEQRASGSGKWARTFIKIARRNRWIMLSATPGDVWLDYIPLFVANGFYRNRTEFLRRHVVFNNFAKFPQVQRYLDTGVLDRRRRQILVDMPVARHTERVRHDIRVDYDKEPYEQALKTRFNPFTDEPVPNAGALCYLLRRLVNDNRRKYHAVLGILARHPRLVVFYNFDYELDILRGLEEEGYRVAEYNGHRHDPLPEGSNWVYLVQYTSGAEGWNCVTTDTMVFFSLNYSYRTMEQAEGRIDRLNTPYSRLNYYRLMTDSPIDKAILAAIYRKKKFNERAFVDAL